jgi:hypothetical protein
LIAALKYIQNQMKKIKRILLTPLLWLAASLFLIEEFIWDSTAKFMARLGAIRAVHVVEKRIATLPPRWAILAFLLPSGILIPAKLIGLHAISQGHWLLGSLTFVVAKIAGMAFFSRIFNLTRPALLHINWFASLYNWVMVYRNRIHAYLDNWSAYQRVKRSLSTMLRIIKGKGRLLRYLRRVSRLKANSNLSK